LAGKRRINYSDVHLLKVGPSDYPPPLKESLAFIPLKIVTKTTSKKSEELDSEKDKEKDSEKGKEPEKEKEPEKVIQPEKIEEPIPEKSPPKSEKGKEPEVKKRRKYNLPPSKYEKKKRPKNKKAYSSSESLTPPSIDSDSESAERDFSESSCEIRKEKETPQSKTPLTVSSTPTTTTTTTTTLKNTTASVLESAMNNKEMYPDIKFKIGKEKIYAHKVVLVGASSVFKKKNSKSKEKKNSENMKRPSTHKK